MVTKNIKKNLIAAALISLFMWTVNGQETTANAGFKVYEDRNRTSSEGFASEEFRRGVQAYYRGAFNESILQFEKALSYMPDDNLILDWLGKAYYKSGLEGSALSYWQSASKNGYGGLLLQNKIEIVRERRVTGESQEKAMRLSEAGSFPGDFNGNLVYSGPVSVLPNIDGTFWVVAYGSNELLMLNQNGAVVKRITGPVNGFDRPSDIIKLSDGKLLVSETAGDRLAVLDSEGKFISYISSKGRGLGQVVGPLYLAEDVLERIYVSDYGNRRIDVFDREGNPLYYFGGKQTGFDGLKGPTGLCAVEESIFVADDQTGSIYEFDRAGNYLRELVEPGTFVKPEAIKLWNGSLVICDMNRICTVDYNTGAVFECVKTGNAPSRVTNASGDINGNLVVSDFTANEIYVMSKIQELVGGMFVQIEQIDASAFPNITVEVKVENRHRQPVVGLQEGNFYLTENKRPVANLQFAGAASNNTDADITFIIDRSKASMQYKSEIESAVKEIVETIGDGNVVRVVSAGSMPVTEYTGIKDGLTNFSLAALKSPLTENSALDLAIRLAANDLINASKKRAIILITGGDQSKFTFDRYNLAELTSYLNNNSIGFSVIQASQNALRDEINYVIENTAGDTYYVFRPAGLKNVVRDIIRQPQGVYQLKYTSTLTTNFGQNYLPVEAEVYLLNRSGRDESGYFAPLQ